MKTYSVAGGGGLKLHVEESGNPNGKPALFIHGISQCGLAWVKQMHSDLSSDYRLVAIDLRGHGLSEKPRDAYGDSKVWADDIHAVITTLGLKTPVLIGWSYAGVVLSDYILHYGETNIAGAVCVGAVSRLGEPLVRPGFLGSEFLECVPGFFSEQVRESVATLEKFIPLCSHKPLSRDDFYFILGYNTVVPPYVRQALLSRTLNNDAVYETMSKPVLLAYGKEDRIALPSMRDHMAGLVKHAKLSVYPNVGHSPFWEAPERFNAELGEFLKSV